MFFTYKDIKEDSLATLKNILKNIKNLFTVQEHYVELVDIETRVYLSGLEETEEIERDGYSITSYDGYTDITNEQKDLEKRGYKIIEKY